MKQVVQYNEHVFEHPRLRVVETAVMDPANLAQIGTRFEFTVTGFVVGETIAEMKQKLTCMRARLSTPRKAFAVDWQNDDGSGTERFFSFDSTTDTEWGPIPGELVIDNFAGGRAAMYAWSLVCVVKDCSSACVISGTPAQVLSVTRVWSHTIDETGLTTRTVAGKLIVRANAGVSADAFRYTCAPGVPTNFRRTSQSYVQSPDGRELDFAVTDQEMMWTLPLPISAGNVSFSINIAELGAFADYRLSGDFKAPPTVSKGTILARIFDLIAVKFPVGDQSFFFGQCEFTESVYENQISFNVNAQAATGQAPNGLPNFQAGLNPLTISPPGSSGQSQKIGAYGGDDQVDSGVIGQMPRAYDACTPAGNPNATTKSPGSLNYDQGGSAPPAGTKGNYADNAGISQEHYNNPYVALHESYSYELDNKLAFFDPKVAGKDPIFQQTAMPSFTVIQAGYLQQLAKTASDVSRPPAPTLGTNGKVLKSSVVLGVPTPVGNGSVNKYTVKWEYIVRYTKKLTTANLSDAELTYPRDLRRPDNNGGKGESIGQLPDLGIVPA